MYTALQITGQHCSRGLSGFLFRLLGGSLIFALKKAFLQSACLVILCFAHCAKGLFIAWHTIGLASPIVFHTSAQTFEHLLAFWWHHIADETALG